MQQCKIDMRDGDPQSPEGYGPGSLKNDMATLGIVGLKAVSHSTIKYLKIRNSERTLLPGVFSIIEGYKLNIK